MNIFYLDEDPVLCARYHNDVHVRKMSVEAAQMLSAVHHKLLEDNMLTHYEDYMLIRNECSDFKSRLYKSTHINHPCTKWIMESSQHYEYVYRLVKALCAEYTYRFGKEHLTWTKMKDVLVYLPIGLEDNGFTQPPQAMLEMYKNEDSVEAYRNYYHRAKLYFTWYTKRKIPDWLLERLTKNELDTVRRNTKAYHLRKSGKVK